MPIKPADIWKLWGRAGGRCSICKAPLTSLKFEGTLGEVAHIVARAETGKRGVSDLSREARDRYDNLILLCPTHHTEVDHDPDGWPIARLKETKSDHERWIQDQIDRGALAPRGDRLEKFLAERQAEWAARADHSWLVSALAPLELDETAIEPAAAEVVSAIKGLRHPEQLITALGVSPNPYHIELFAQGLLVEDFRFLRDGLGYRLEVHRTGFLELAICLDELLRRPFRHGWANNDAVRLALARANNRLDKGLQPLEYQAWSELATWSIQTVLRLWRELDLPFEDAIGSVQVLAPEGTYLFVEGFGRVPVAGRAMTGRELVYRRLVTEREDPDNVTLEVLADLVAQFGLVLSIMESADGRVAVPGRLQVT